MLANALLFKISIALAALIALLGLWYHEYYQNSQKQQEAQKQAALVERVQRESQRQPTAEQRREAEHFQRKQFSGYRQFQRHALDGLGGKK